MKTRSRSLLALLLGGLALSAALAQQDPTELVLDPDMHHLGNDETPEWTEAPSSPEGSGLDFEFQTKANAEEWTLVYTQRNINDRWSIHVNGEEVIVLDPAEELVEVFQPLPAGTFLDGRNRFELRTNQPADDITFGRVRLVQASFREVLDLRAVRVRVTDRRGGEPIPARVTILDMEGQRVPVHYAASYLQQATRAGVVYSTTGEARFEVPAGNYQVIASRGSEWSMDDELLDLTQQALDAEPALLELSLEHEVDTRGWVAADTHIHTLTFSGHGDSNVEERMVTLAGEGVELAISTDHNHNTDYEPYQQRMGLDEHFTPVVGNEVTTPIGHFNAFPLDPADAVPVFDLRDVIPTVADMRAKGALAVILNHPRWPTHEEGPFGVIELNHFTGASKGAPYTEYPFDAMELINSCTAEPEPMLLFEDWFSLLNRGERVFAVGSSDSHTVGEPVGGGRTYVPSATDEPAQIDVDAACRAIAEGRTSISMGIFVTGEVSVAAEGERQAVGATVTAGVAPLVAHLRVQAPSWVRPRQARLIINGATVHEEELEVEEGSHSDLDLSFTLPEDLPRQDAWCLWVVTGDGAGGEAWPLSNDYTLGATNPIFLDLDGDGAYTPPRATAQDLVAETGLDLRALRGRLAASHPAVVYHALEQVRALQAERDRRELEALGEATAADPDSMEAFLEGLAR